MLAQPLYLGRSLLQRGMELCRPAAVWIFKVEALIKKCVHNNYN